MVVGCVWYSTVYLACSHLHALKNLYNCYGLLPVGSRKYHNLASLSGVCVYTYGEQLHFDCVHGSTWSPEMMYVKFIIMAGIWAWLSWYLGLVKLSIACCFVLFRGLQ